MVSKKKATKKKVAKKGAWKRRSYIAGGSTGGKKKSKPGLEVPTGDNSPESQDHLIEKEENDE